MNGRIVSWNIHRCFGTDRRYDPARVARAIQSLNADIVALQEVDSSLRVGSEWGADLDQLTFLALKTGMKVAMGPTLHRDYGAYGNAILSRTELSSTEEYDLSYRKYEPRGALVAETELGGRTVRVINTHLGLKGWERTYQIEKLLALDLNSASLFEERPTGPLNQPIFLLGDFNEWLPFTRRRFRLEKPFRFKTPRLRTFPSSRPRVCLDRIFATGEIQEFRQVPLPDRFESAASDHLPVIADFAF